VLVYRKLATSLLPGAAEKFESPQERISPVELNEWRSWEYSCGYVLAGRKFTRSILFIKLDREREIRVTLDTRAADFEKLRDNIYASLASWLEEPV
jgi:hypothetical protein